MITDILSIAYWVVASLWGLVVALVSLAVTAYLMLWLAAYLYRFINFILEQFDK